MIAGRSHADGGGEMTASQPERLLVRADEVHQGPAVREVSPGLIAADRGV